MKYKKIIAYAMSLAMIFPIANGIINIPTAENSIVVSADDSISTAEVVANTLMNNQSVWNELLTLSDGIKGATFLDVDFDGELELVVSNQQGTIRDTYTEIYKIDTVNNKVIEVTDNSSDYIVDGSHYSMDILQYDVELYTATEDLGEIHSKGDTFYLCTDCLYDSANYMELATIQLTGDSTGTFQKPLFNTITENGVSKHYQCVFNSPNDTWLEDDGDEASEYIGLKNLNLTYSIVAKDGKVTANDLIKSYNAFSYDGFTSKTKSDSTTDKDISINKTSTTSKPSIVAVGNAETDANSIINTIMENKSIWYDADAIADETFYATFLDLDFDGELEFIVASNQGEDYVTYANVYKVIDNSLVEIPLNVKNIPDVTLDGYLKLYNNTAMNINEYVCADLEAIGDHEYASRQYGFYASNNTIKYNYYYTECQDATGNITYYNSEDETSAISKETYDSLVTDFNNTHKDLNVSFKWIDISSSNLSDNLLSAYNTFSYDGFSGNSQEQDVVDTSNKCGDNAYWSFDETTHTLTISGTGAMYDYDNSYFDASWFELAGQESYEVGKIVIKDGITYIGDYAFAPFSMVNSVTLPNTLTEIGDYAFMCFRGDNGAELPEITIPSSVTKIGTQAVGYYFTTYTDENGDTQGKNSLIENFTIKGYTGTEAETYAKENGIKFVALDTPSDDIKVLNENDIITLTGTVKSEDYEINEMNKGTAIILELDTPVTYAFYGDTNGVYTDGQEVLVKSVQLSGIDNSYIGKKVKVTGSVMFGHTAHHLRDIVLLDCTVSLVDNPITTTTDPGKTVTTTTTSDNGKTVTTTTPSGKSSPITSDSGVGKFVLLGTLIGAVAVITSKKKK